MWAPASRRRPPARRTCSGAASLSRAATGLPATSTSARSALWSGRRRWPRKRWRCCPRPCCRRAAARSSCTRRSCTSRSTSRCGHPTELDRVFGTEAAYAGTSFLTTDKLERGFRYGSDLVTLVADATTPGGLGTFGWDDEGVAAQRVALVSEGIFSGYLTQPRDGAPHRPQQWRGRARRRLEPAAAHPHDQHQPRAAPRHEPRGHHRRHRRRPLPRVQPQLVHRRPPAQLPVRRRAGARDQGRPARAALPERHLHGHHAPVLGLPATPWPTSAPGCWSASPTAARGSPARACTSATAAAAPASATSRWGSGTDERPGRSGLDDRRACRGHGPRCRSHAGRGTRHPHAQRPDPLRQQRAPPERGRGGHGRQPAVRGWPARRRGLAQPPRRGRPGPTGGVRRGHRAAAARAERLPLAARPAPHAARSRGLRERHGRG